MSNTLSTMPPDHLCSPGNCEVCKAYEEGTPSTPPEEELYELCLRQVKHISQCKLEVCSGCPALARQLEDDFKDYLTKDRAERDVELLNKVHRANGAHDYDNETDEYIDELIAQLDTNEGKVKL